MRSRIRSARSAGIVRPGSPPISADTRHLGLPQHRRPAHFAAGDRHAVRTEGLQPAGCSRNFFAHHDQRFRVRCGSRLSDASSVAAISSHTGHAGQRIRIDDFADAARAPDAARRHRSAATGTSRRLRPRTSGRTNRGRSHPDRTDEDCGLMASAVREPRTRGGSDCSDRFRRLVLHADDFGMNELVNGGILRGFSHGLLTSTSILANAPGCAAALAAWKDLEVQFSNDDLPSRDLRRRLVDSAARFDLGIHLNLTQGRPLTQGQFPPQLLDRNGRFPGVFALAARLLAAGRKYRRPIEDELCAQIEFLVDHGVAPTHLNAHQYVDLLPIMSTVIPRLLRRYAIPVVRTPWETRLTQTTLLHQFEPANWCVAQIKRLLAFHHLMT